MGAGGSTAAQAAVWEAMDKRQKETVAYLKGAPWYGAVDGELKPALSGETKVLLATDASPTADVVSGTNISEYDAMRTRPWNKDCHGYCLPRAIDIPSPSPPPPTLFISVKLHMCEVAACSALMHVGRQQCRGGLFLVGWDGARKPRGRCE